MEKIDNIIDFYNEVSDEKIDVNGIMPIIPMMKLVLEKVEFDDIEMLSLIDTLLEFKKLGVLDKINEESLKLLSRVIGNDSGFYEEDKSYFCLRLKHLLVPCSLNKCNPLNEVTKDDELVKYLAEMDIMLNNMAVELNEDDLKLLKKYNEELFNVLICYKDILRKYENIDVEKTNFISDAIIINSTLSHLASMLYFCLDMYEYRYDLMDKVFERIINNYQEYLFDCRNYDIYTDRTNLIFDPSNIYNEYVICKDMLDKEFYHETVFVKQRSN